MKTIKSSLLSKHSNLLHAFTTKEGGFSLAPYLSNNLAYHVDDKISSVNKNHSILATSLNYPQNKLVRMNQIHGNIILEVTKQHNYENIPSCDALITNQLNTPLMVMVADCIPILLYDPIQKAIGAIHAGRAGIFSEIIPLTISKMQKTYQSKSKDILISIGPSIHECCYEVGEEIKEEAYKQGYQYAIKEKNSSYYLDLLSIAKKQLQESQILENNIEISPYCTACNTDTFYSYRAEKKCGRFAGIIMLKEQSKSKKSTDYAD